MSDALAKASAASQALEAIGPHIARIKQEALDGMLRCPREDRDDLLSLARACDALTKRLHDDVSAGLIEQRRAELDDMAG